TETLRGQGSFIRNDPSLVVRIREEMAREALRSFVLEMRSLGFTDDEVMRLTAEALHNTEPRQEETADAEGGSECRTPDRGSRHGREHGRAVAHPLRPREQEFSRS